MNIINTWSEAEQHVASQSFADFVGVAMAALATEPMKSILENTSKTSPGNNKLPNGMTVSCEKAAFGWATAAHFLDFDDLSVALIGHPSAVLYAAILPVAYELDCSGADVITAYLTGYEKLLQVSSVSAEAQYARGWHTTSSIGVLGATAAVCSLKDFEPDCVASALGIAASFAAGLRVNFGTVVKPIHAGWAAGAAIQACELAELGVSSSPDVFSSEISYFNVFAGLEPKAPSADGRIDTDLAVKIHAACGFAARPIDAALEVREGSQEFWHRLETIACSISPLANDVLKFRRPGSGAEAKFSLEYCVAYALVHGSVSLNAFNGSPFLISPDVASVMERIERVVDFKIDSGLKNEIAGLEVTFGSGETARSEVRVPRGYPKNRLNDSELKAKFRDCVKGSLQAVAIDEMFERCTHVSRQESMRTFIDDLTTLE